MYIVLETIRKMFKSLHESGHCSYLAPESFQWSSSWGLAPCQAPTKTCVGSLPTWEESRWSSKPPDFLDESNEEDEEFSFDKGFSHAHPLSMTQGHKVVRSEELPLLIEKPFSWWGQIKSLVWSSTSLVWIVQADPTVLDRWGTSLCWSWQCCPRAQHALLAMWSGKSVKSLNIKNLFCRPPSL